MYPLESNEVTCAWGVPGSWMAGRHTGIDLRAPVGTPLYACLGGKVVHAGRGGAGEAYGVHLIIESQFEGRTIRVLYAHLEHVHWSARLWRKVKTGQRLGRTGDTGNVTGPHLHLEVRHSPYNYWAYENPQPVLSALPATKRSWLRRK